MKFWLACFGLLFISAELYQWVAELGSFQASGSWLILGGMALAAASNAAHLPKTKLMPKKADGAVPISESDAKASGAVDQCQNQCQNESAEGHLGDTHEQTQKSASKPLSVEEQSAEDSISFKVHFPWR